MTNLSVLLDDKFICFTWWQIYLFCLMKNLSVSLKDQFICFTWWKIHQFHLMTNLTVSLNEQFICFTWWKIHLFHLMTNLACFRLLNFNQKKYLFVRLFGLAPSNLGLQEHTWYLSHISHMRYVEKNLSCEKISDLYAWQMWRNLKFVQIWRIFKISTHDQEL